MSKLGKLKYFWFVLIAVRLLVSETAASFTVETHEELTSRAAPLSVLKADDLLTATLPEFWLGLEQEVVPGSKVNELISKGAKKEDDVPRFLHHFHDPTSSWGSAGLGGTFSSSVYWQQSDGDSSRRQWVQARDLYRRALIERDAAERQRLFKETFESIGHIVHLIQDAATPSHTRDDPHPLHDAFHVWADVDNHLFEVLDLTPIPFGGALTPTSDQNAPRPVARIIDATELDRGQYAFGTDIGIAEYSNSQFLSDNRTFWAYDRPDFEDMEVVDGAYTGAVPFSMRRYLRFSSPEEGETDYWVAAQSPIQRSVRREKQRYLTIVDDKNVLRGYGEKLIPRAVGYSVTAIDYFFRGRIEISAPNRFVYGRAEYGEGNTSSFTTLRFKVKNVSPTGPAQEPGSQGQIWAVVHYRTSQSNLFEDPASALSAEPVYAVSDPEPLTISRSPQEVRFDFPDGIPANAADVWLIVVYKGDLGGEKDAVMVGGKDLPEPQPVDYANLTDYACPDGEPLYLPAISPGDPSRNLPGGGKLLGPYLETNQARRLWNISYQVGSNPYDLGVPETRVENGVTPMTRYVVLRDADTNPAFQQFKDGSIRDVEGRQIAANVWGQCDLYAIRNDYNRGSIEHDVINPNQDLITFRRFPTTESYRGWTGFKLQYLYERSTGGLDLSSGGFDSCLSTLDTAEPSLTYAPSSLAPEE